MTEIERVREDNVRLLSLCLRMLDQIRALEAALVHERDRAERACDTIAEMEIERLTGSIRRHKNRTGGVGHDQT